jgi:hypothetical protein
MVSTSAQLKMAQLWKFLCIPLLWLMSILDLLDGDGPIELAPHGAMDLVDGEGFAELPGPLRRTTTNSVWAGALRRSAQHMQFVRAHLSGSRIPNGSCIHHRMAGSPSIGP